MFFGNRTIVLVFLPFLIGGYYFCNYFTEYHSPESPASFGLWGAVEYQSHIAMQVPAMLLIFINAIVINALFNRNDFMGKNNFLPAMLYVTFLSFFHSFYFLDGLAIGQSLLVLVLFQLFRLYQNEDGRRAVFNAALIFGLACTFYPTLLLGTPFLFWMVWVIRPFILRESVLIISGFITPLIYSGVYAYIKDIQLDLYEFSSAASSNIFEDVIVFIGIVLVLLLMSLGSIFNKVSSSSIRLKKLFRMMVLLIIFLLSVILLEFFVFNKTDSISLLVFPLVLLLPFAFGVKEQRMLPTTIFYLLFFFSVGKFFIEHDYLGINL